MNRVSFNTDITGEGIPWLINSSPWEECKILQEKDQLKADIDKLFFPDTVFAAPGMDRKSTEEDEEDDEDIDSCDSSEDDMGDELPDLSGFGD